MKNNQCNLISNPRKINKKFAKLKVKFWASVFVFLAIISAGGFFIFSGINFKMIAQALSGNYGKTTGGTLTADEWNNLDNDFLSAETDPTVPANIKDGTAWSEISGKPDGLVVPSIWFSGEYGYAYNTPTASNTVNLGTHTFCALGIVLHDGDNGGGCNVYKSDNNWYLNYFKWGSGGINCKVNCF